MSNAGERPASSTGITFSSHFADTLPGLTVAGLPPTAPCREGSILRGDPAAPDHTLILEGSLVPAGFSSQFTVQLLVPETLSKGQFITTTTPLQAAPGDDSVILRGATGLLEVSSHPLTSPQRFGRAIENALE